MDITPEVIEALAILREEAKYQEGAGHPVMEAFRKLDAAGVFRTLDDVARAEEPAPAPQPLPEEPAPASRPTPKELRRKLGVSGPMMDELEFAARHGWQGEAPFINRKTEDALLRRGLLTYDYDRTHFASVRENGYANPVLTVAGWAVTGIERPADAGRYSLAEALAEAYDPSVSVTWKMSRNSDVCRWEGPLTGFVPSLYRAAQRV